MHSISQNKRKLSLTVIANISLKIVTAITGFILPPLIITTFGSKLNGMVGSICQFISYINLVEAGIASAGMVALYKPLSDNDVQKRNQILSAVAKFYNKSGLLFIVLILALAIIYPFIIRGQVDYLTAFLMVLALGITGVMEFFFIGKYRVLINADNRSYVISFIRIVGLILNLALSILLIRLGCSLVIVKFSASLLFLSRCYFVYLYVKKRYPDISFKEVPDYNSIKQSKNVLIHQIAYLVCINSSLIIISLFCSLEDASVYSIYFMLFYNISNIMGCLVDGFSSFFGQILVTGDMEKSNKLYNCYENVFYSIMSWVYIVSLCLALPFIDVYTCNMNDANYRRPLLMVLFVVVKIIDNARLPASTLITAAGHFKKTQTQALIETGINLFFSIILTMKFGIIGIPLGAIIAFVYRTPEMLVYINRNILTRNCVKSFMHATVYVIVELLISILLRKYIVINVTNYGLWLIKALVYGSILGIIPGLVVIKNLRTLIKK